MSRRQNNSTRAWSWLERSAYRTVLTILIGLVLLPVLVICAIVIGLATAIMWLGWLLFEKLALQYWFLGAHPRRAPWLRPVTVAGACFLVAGVINASRGNVFGQVVVGTTAIITVFAGLVVGAAFLGSIYDTRHKAKTAQVAMSNAHRTTDYIMRRRFELEHPEWVTDDDRYHRWRKRFEQYLMAIHYMTTVDEIKPGQILVHIEVRFYQRYPHLMDAWGYLLAGNELAKAIDGTAQKPKSSKVRVATSLLAFIWSVIRVTKWRVCPLVQLPVR